MPTPITIKVYRRTQEDHGHDALLNTFTFAQDAIKIGRLAGSHIQLDDEGVARMHAVIDCDALHATPTGVQVIDLGAAAGTRLTGVLVPKTAVLVPGENEIDVGPFRLVVTVPAEASKASKCDRADVLAAVPEMTERPHEFSWAVDEQSTLGAGSGTGLVNPNAQHAGADTPLPMAPGMDLPATVTGIEISFTPGNPVATVATVTDILVTPAQREAVRARLAALWDAAQDAKWRHRTAAGDFAAAMAELRHEVSVAAAFGLPAHVDPLLKLDPSGAL